MLFSFTAAIALCPSLLLVWYFHHRDRNPEPARVVWTTFFLGVVIVAPVLAVDQPLGLIVARAHGPYLHGLADAFFTAGLPEELFKFLVVTLYCARHREFDEPMDGVVYGAIASLGFATIENVLYVTELGTGVALLRAFTAVPGHAFMGALMGYFVGQAKFSRSPSTRRRLYLTAYVVPVVLHTLYDFPVLAQKGNVPEGEGAAGPAIMLLALAVLTFEWIWVARVVGRLRDAQDAQSLVAANALARLFAVAPLSDGPALALAAGGEPTSSAPVATLPPTAPNAALQHPRAAMQWPNLDGQTPPDAAMQQRLPPSDPSAPPRPIAAPTASSPRHRLRGWVLSLLGGALVTGGFFVALAVLLALPDEKDRAALLLGGFLIGLVPLALGGVLFARGVVDLARR